MYALEGSVTIAGAVVQWMKDNLEILHKIEDSENIANSIAHNDNHITFVPAFSGLYAPYWKKDARRYQLRITKKFFADIMTKSLLLDAQKYLQEMFTK